MLLPHPFLEEHPSPLSRRKVRHPFWNCWNPPQFNHSCFSIFKADVNLLLSWLKFIGDRRDPKKSWMNFNTHYVPDFNILTVNIT